MKMLSKLTTISGGLLVLTLAACGLIAGLWFMQGGRIAVVQTGSMQPQFYSGDALLVMPAKDYASGDIIRYQSQTSSGITITHRVVGIYKNNWVITKGDALSEPDRPVPKRLVQGRVAAVLPGFGRLINLLQKPATLLAVIYIPALLLLTNEAWRLAQDLRKPYRSPGYRT